jgi:hypothetical protein
MTNLSNTLQAPDARARRDAIAAKRADADVRLAHAMTDLETLNARSEIEPADGAAVTTLDLAKARKVRDTARDEVERLGAALAQSERLVSEAEAADADAAIGERWDEVADMRRRGERQLSEAENALAAAGEAVDRYLKGRIELFEQSPVRDDVANVNANVGFVHREGMDRMLRVEELLVRHFHPDYRRGGHHDWAAEAAKLLEAERQALALFGTRPAASKSAA